MSSSIAAIDAMVGASQPSPAPLPGALLHALAPATHYVREWQEYWVRWPDATRLRVGNDWVEPVQPGYFRLKFENQLGLTSVQPFGGQVPLAAPLNVEVVSPKFADPEAHHRFFQALLNDLFARAARLPFFFAGPTSRGVAQSLQPPTPLFVYYFLLQHGPQLRQALEIVRAAPHRLLVDHSTYLPLSQVSEADPSVIVDMMHSPHRWAKARGFRLAERLGGFAPTHVHQRRSEETLDTPENRFVLAFLRQVLTAAEKLPAESWWKKVAQSRMQAIVEVTSLVRQTLAWSMFREVGIMERVPLSSQVLLRQEGYRDLRDLYWRFHQARRPLFEPLRTSIEVRDIATLYEQWCFFALVEEIGAQLGVTPRLDLLTSDEYGLNWNVTATFGHAGKLIYNRGKKGYSISLRPDFAWASSGRWEVVLDAKFRLRRQEVDVEDDVPEKLEAQVSDLIKMHAYRDALDLRAAVAVYPGNVSVFYDHSSKQRCHDVTLADVLVKGRSGVGAFALSPLSINDSS